MSELRKVCLLSCVSVKVTYQTKAKDLYISPWFVKARALVERSAQPWFILSAKHGLLSPDTIISPYEKTLNMMRVAERRDWADMVKKQMDETLPDVDEVVVLAGSNYRENIMSYLQARFPKISVPMEGLKIGEQLSWMAHAKTI